MHANIFPDGSSAYSRAFDHWKCVHDRLVSNLDDFFAECSRLDSILKQPSACGWQGLEESLRYVDSTLASLDTWPSRIQNARAALGAVRNRSKSLVPPNKLPTEVIVHILSLLGTDCTMHYHSKTKVPSPPLAAICVTSKWFRNVATSTSSLWNHVDFSLDRPEAEYMSYARSCLRYSQERCLYIHVVGTKFEYKQNPIIAMIVLLISHKYRIVSMNFRIGIRSAKAILFGLLVNAPSSEVKVRELCLDDWRNSQTDPYGGAFDSCLDGFLESLQVVRIKGPFLPLQSVTFRGLTVLKLSVRETLEFPPTLAQLTAVLSACPKLRALALVSCQFDTDSAAPNEPVFMPNLELLDLRDSTTDALLALLACITPGSSKLTLSVPGDPDMPNNETTRLYEYINQSNVTRLQLESPWLNDDEDKKSPPLLTHLFPTIQELALCDYDINQVGDIRPMDVKRFPSLHTLHLLQCDTTPDSLRSLVRSSAIQTVYTDDVKFKLQPEGVVPFPQYRHYSHICQDDHDLEWPLLL